MNNDAKSKTNKCYRAISFDVGIKNLAYCLMEVDNDKIKIVDWDIINLVDEQKIVCMETLKNKKNCGHLPKFMGLYPDGTTKYYCGTHKNMYNPTTDDFFNALTIDKNSELEAEKYCSYIFPKKDTKCEKLASHKFNNNNYCNTHKNLTISKLKSQMTLKKFKKTKSSALSPEVLATRMYKSLDKIKNILDIDQVLIENQPTLKNPTMKTISSMLFSYFILRGIIDSDKIKSVRFISPSNKLKVNEDKTLAILSKTDKNETYKMTKSLAIQYTKILLKDDKKWLNHLDKYKKKDDLCDAFLQGYHFIYKNII